MPSSGSTPSTSGSPAAEQSPEENAPRDPATLAGHFGDPSTGSRLRLLGTREQTAEYTSYDATYRSDRWLVSGVLNVPNGPGPFPAVVLAHGYIDPEYYVSGQGMTRERTLLAQRGMIAFHVDYRNHAGSDTDPALRRNFHLGYSVDILNAVRALRASDLPVDDANVALMGRSMGGSVVLRALEMSPSLVAAGIIHSSSSSQEADNYRVWGGLEDGNYGAAAREHGTPDSNPAAWRDVSSRTYFERIDAPLLVQHGALDPVCDPRWASETGRLLQLAGADARLIMYAGEGHTFDRRFVEVMDEAIGFMRSEFA